MMSSRAVRLCLLGFSVALGGIVACGSDSDGTGVDISMSSNPANVAIDLRDSQGNHVGFCSGTLVSSTAVLTAGHCVVAANQWVITAPGANGQGANGARVFTTWRNFHSQWTHPEHSDVGVILLDRPILLSSYPTIAGSLATDGTRMARMRRAGAYASGSKVAFEEVSSPAYQGVEKGVPLEYYSDAGFFEGQVDTGGALLDTQSDTIYGVVSGKGLQTGRMYSARVDYLKEWIDAIASCSPPPMTIQCLPGQDSGASSSSSGGSSGGSSGWGSSSGSGSGSGGSSSGGGMDDGGSCNPPPAPPPPPPPPGSHGDGGGGGHDCGSSSSGGSSSSSSSSSGGGVDVNDGGYVITVPPDGPGCIDSTCGGCGNDPSCDDNQQDYGDCGCTPQPPTPPQPLEAGPVF